MRIALTFLLIPLLSISQPRFELTREGVEPITIDIDTMPATRIYQKALNWIKESYRSPDDVLKAKIENEMLRITAFKKSAWFMKELGQRQNYDADYSFTIDIKDNRIRLTYIPEQFWADGRRLLYDYRTFFKSSGEVKNSYADAKKSYEATMNDLVDSLYSYLTGSKKEW